MMLQIVKLFSPMLVLFFGAATALLVGAMKRNLGVRKIGFMCLVVLGASFFAVVALLMGQIGQQDLEQDISKEQILEQQDSRQQNLGQEILGQQNLGQKDSAQEMLGQQNLGQKDLGEDILGQQNLEQQNSEQQILRRQALGQQHLEQKDLGQDILPKEKAMSQYVFAGAYIFDGFGLVMCLLVLFAAMVCLVLSFRFMEHEDIKMVEYPILLLLATLGMMLMITSNNMIALYLGLELQSLCLYVMATSHLRSARCGEAGVKYFVLGALASCFLLYGISLLYGFLGSVNFDVLASNIMLLETQQDIGVVLGIVFILAAFAFKLSAAPFHMWTPDVYEGAPSPTTAFLASAPKIAALALLMRVLFSVLPDMFASWQQIIVFLSIVSLLLGSFGAIGQSNIKRLIAYSSIGHIGFMFLALTAGEAGIEYALVYLMVYVVMTLGVFACILGFRHESGEVQQIDGLKGLSITRPFMAFSLAVFMFSMAGIPPLAGFFAKFYILIAVVEKGFYFLAILGVLASVVAAYYYLRIVKIMYLDKPTEHNVLPLPRELSIISFLCAFFVCFFFIMPEPFNALALYAKHTLLQ